MSHDGSVTHWINELKVGAEGAAQQELWNRYFQQLAGVARRRLKNLPDRVADEEDVVASAFESFFMGVRRDRFPVLRDRNNLWPLLVTITARKALNQQRRSRAAKRGGDYGKAEPVRLDGEREGRELEQIIGTEPSPAFAAELAEECQQRLASLDERLRVVAERKLQGYTNREIATELNVIVETVERRLRRIRELWTKWDDDSERS